MILALDSTLPSFKNLRFRTGLNVVLSTKLPGSNDKNTRNSAGKSSFIELVHFLLGAKCDKDSLFKTAALAEHIFSGRFRLAGTEITVSRSGATQKNVFLEEGPAERLGLRVKRDKESGAVFVSNTEWNEILGHKMFELPETLEGSAYGESYTPGFRPMFSYFARRIGSDAFISPELQARQQARWDWQINLSYLLGVDWRTSFDLHKVRQRERSLEELKKAAKAGALGSIIGTSAEIHPRVVAAEASAAKLRTRLDRFEVVESFRELSAEAAAAKSEIQAIARRAVSLNETLTHLRSAIEREQPPASSDIERLYAQVGVELPGVVHRRFEEISAFHQSVVTNRRAYLTGEIVAAEEELRQGEELSAELEQRRTQILAVLSSGGALDDFVDLQKLFAEAEAGAAALREKLKAAESLEKESTQLDIDRAAIKLRLMEGLRSSKSSIEEAMLLIGGTIEELYEDRTGKFEVEATDNGPEFRISIQGDRGTGISNMEIFSFDHALFAIWSKRGKGPGFLIHDSHLFDGVDERQVARAIKLGAITAEIFSGQYIVCLNSDIFDGLALEPEIDREKVVIKPVLSDQESGGLFGFRFD